MKKEKELQYKKAYVELNEIIKVLSDEQKDKIPEVFKNNLIENMDTEYKFEFDDTKGIFEQDLMVETKALLVEIYERYLAPEEEKELWEKYDRFCLNKIEERREKYKTDNKYDSQKIDHRSTDSEINQDVINDLVGQLKKANFSEDQIEHILELVRGAGSIEAATDYLRGILEKTLDEKDKNSDENNNDNNTVNEKSKDESGSVEAKKENDTLSEKGIDDFDYEITGTTLTITGSGAIPFQEDYDDYPWNRYPCKRVVIAEGITRLPGGSIWFPEAEKVVLPESLTEIDAGAFEGMRALRRLQLGKNIVKIDSGFFDDIYSSFYGDEPFCEIIVSKDNPVYRSIGGVLYSKDAKTLVRFPVNKNVKNGTFKVKKGVEKIAPSAFSKTGDKLEKIILPSTIKEIGERAFEWSFIKHIVLPQSITKIPACAFLGCGCLEEISLPDSVSKIETEAFSYSSLKSIVIPEGVERIESYAFEQALLGEIYLPTTINFIGKNAFHELIDGLYYRDELIAKGNLTSGYDHEKVTIEEDGNDLLLDALYDVPDIKGQVHFWEVKFCYGTGAGFTEWEKFNVSCNEEEFDLLQTLSSKQKKQDIDKVKGLKALVERIENKIENIIRDENDPDYADWILNDDGIIRYRVKGFTESGM